MRRRHSLLWTFLLTTAAAAQPVPQDQSGTDAPELAQQATDLDRRVVQLLPEGKAAQALPLAKHSLQIRRRLYPPDRYPNGHADLAKSLNNLAYVHRAMGDLARAEAGFREALEVRRKLYPPTRYPDGHPDLAQALNALGVLLTDRGDLAAAEPLQRQALAMRRKLYPPDRFPDGHSALGNSIMNVGALLRSRGDLAGAEPLLREGLAMQRRLYPAERFPAGHPDLVVGLSHLATLLRLRGDLAGAEPLLREALDLEAKLYPPERYPAGHPELARSLLSLCILLHARGDLAGAEAFCHQAVAMQERLYPKERYPAGHPDLAQSLVYLAGLLKDRGDLAAAEALVRRSLDMYRRLCPKERFPQGHPYLAMTLNNLASVLWARGEQAAAEPLAREGLAMQQKLYPAERFPAGHPELANGLHNLSAILRARGDLAGAEALCRDGLAMQRRLFPKERYPDGHAELVQSINNLGTLRVERGDLAGAEPLLREALAMRRILYPPKRYPDGHPSLATGLHNLAALLQERGDRAGAAPLYREALGMHQRLTEHLLAGTSEAEAFNHLASLPLTRDGYLDVTDPGPTDADAYAAVWDSKAILARWLTYRRLALTASADPGTRDLAGRLTATRRELAGLLLAPASGPDQAERVRRLGASKEELEKELGRQLPAFADWQRRSRQPPDALHRALPAGTAFIDLLRYVGFDHGPARPGERDERRTAHYLAFVLCRDGPIRRVELGPAQPIEAVLIDWRKALAGDGGARAAARLRQLVWTPLEKQLPAGTETIWIAPDDRLTGLPWAALPGRKPGSVLLEEYALAVVPHGQALLAGLERKDRLAREEGTVLTVGGVAYDGVPNLKGADGQPAPAARLHWPALPATAQEVARVAALAGKRTLRTLKGDEASSGRLLADLPKVRWAHLATHGFFADASFRSVLHLDEKAYEHGRGREKIGVGARNPLVLSGLVLAGANRKGDGGILTAESIASLSLEKLDLAVLSACETGLGEVAGGEGVFGLQRAFHLAGAKNVVASLWQVDDEATAALMALFYHKLWQENLPSLEALRQAQLALYHHPERIGSLARLRGPDFEKAARLPVASGGASARRAPPRLWAGFVLSGVGR
jgi:CHAT domain-containing protein/tetratricopeptide (TPR) repeat protein